MENSIQPWDSEENRCLTFSKHRCLYPYEDTTWPVIHRQCIRRAFVMGRHFNRVKKNSKKKNVVGVWRWNLLRKCDFHWLSPLASRTKLLGSSLESMPQCASRHRNGKPCREWKTTVYHKPLIWLNATWTDVQALALRSHRNWNYNIVDHVNVQ